jgi:hypothetical protein
MIMARLARSSRSTPHSRRQPTEAQRDRTMAKLFEKVSRENDRIMRSELEAERLPAELMSFKLKSS